MQWDWFNLKGNKKYIYMNKLRNLHKLSKFFKILNMPIFVNQHYFWVISINFLNYFYYKIKLVTKNHFGTLRQRNDYIFSNHICVCVYIYPHTHISWAAHPNTSNFIILSYQFHISLIIFKEIKNAQCRMFLIIFIFVYSLDS